MTPNPYQVMYNNAGAAAYQPTWGYTDIGAHYLGIRSTLPLGYTRRQYEEERALAAETMWKSPLYALGAFTSSAAVTYATFGSPVQGLAEKIGGNFLNSFNSGVVGAAWQNQFWASAALKDAQYMQAVREGSWDNAAQAMKRLKEHTILPSAPTNGFAATLGNMTRSYNSVAETVNRWSSAVYGGIGRVAGSAVSTPTGFIAEKAINKVASYGAGWTGGNWDKQAGGWLKQFGRNGLSGMATTQQLEAARQALSEATTAFEQVAGTEAAKDAYARVIAAEQELSKLGGTGWAGTWNGIKRTAFSASKTIGTTLSENGWGGVARLAITKGTGAVVGGVAKIAGGFLSPTALAQAYIVGQTLEYGGDTYENYQNENEIQRGLMAKSSRILRFGMADRSQGLEAGLSLNQRERIVTTIKDMAKDGARRYDLFGFGDNGLFGGHHAYSERLKELKSILSVGTDMGYFDMSKSIDDFEKKFKETVKTVDKLSRMLKKTKGEVMTAIANVQQTEGLYNMGAAEMSVARKDFAARLTGVDYTVAAQEGAAGAGMAQSMGINAAFGASRMASNRVLLSRVIRNGDLDRNTIFNLGGEQNILAQLTQGDLSIMNSKAFLVELAMDMEKQSDGSFRRTGKRIARMSSASSDDLFGMAAERDRFANAVTYSYAAGGRVSGGAVLDRINYVKEAIRNGSYSEAELNTVIKSLAIQRGRRVLGGNSATNEEYLAQGLAAEMHLPIEVARIQAKNLMRTSYDKYQLEDRMAVEKSRRDTAYENSGVSAWNILWGSAKDAVYSTGAAAPGAGAIVGMVTGSGGTAGMAAVAAGLAVGTYYGGKNLWNLTKAYWGKLTGDKNYEAVSDLSKRLAKEGLRSDHVARYFLGDSASDYIRNFSMSEIDAAENFVNGDTPLKNRLDAGLRGDSKVSGFIAGYTDEVNTDLSEAMRAVAAESKHDDIYSYMFDSVTENAIDNGSYASIMKAYGISKKQMLKISKIARAAKEGKVQNMSKEMSSDMGKVIKAAVTAYGSKHSDYETYAATKEILDKFAIDGEKISVGLLDSNYGYIDAAKGVYSDTAENDDWSGRFGTWLHSTGTNSYEAELQEYINNDAFLAKSFNADGIYDQFGTNRKMGWLWGQLHGIKKLSAIELLSGENNTTKGNRVYDFFARSNIETLGKIRNLFGKLSGSTNIEKSDYENIDPDVMEKLTEAFKGSTIATALTGLRALINKDLIKDPEKLIELKKQYNMEFSTIRALSDIPGQGKSAKLYGALEGEKRKVLAGKLNEWGSISKENAKSAEDKAKYIANRLIRYEGVYNQELRDEIKEMMGGNDASWTELRKLAGNNIDLDELKAGDLSTDAFKQLVEKLKTKVALAEKNPESTSDPTNPNSVTDVVGKITVITDKAMERFQQGCVILKSMARQMNWIVD